MKRSAILFLFISWFLVASAQEPEVAKFEDGSQITFTVHDKHTDKMAKFNLFIHSSVIQPNLSIGYNLRASYFIADMLLVQAGFTFNLEGGGKSGADVLYFIKSNEKEKVTSLTLKSEQVGRNTVLKKKVKYPIVRKTYFGIHGGFYQTALPMGFDGYSMGKGSGSFLIHKVSTPEIQIGLGLYRGRYAKWTVPGRFKKSPSATYKGATHLNIVLDLQYYPGAKVDYEEITQDVNGNPIVSGETLSKTDFIKPFAFRLLLTGKSGVSKKRETGLFYSIGVGTSPFVYQGSTISPYGGLGIAIGIGK